MPNIKYLLFVVLVITGLVFTMLELSKPNFKVGDCIVYPKREYWHEETILLVNRVGKHLYNFKFANLISDYSFDEKIKNIDSEYKKVDCTTGRPI